ncbi:MAG: hypothetical protein QOH88_2050 [Verrucomicrobiota bacterium]|jgi:hypothetical protein
MILLSTLSPDQKRRVAAIDPSLIQPIGELTVNFAMLESILKRGIECLLFPGSYSHSKQDTAAIITAEMSFRRLIHLFECLIRDRCGESNVQACKALCVEMLRIEEKRNAIIHSEWGLDARSRLTVRMKTTAKAKGLRRHRERLRAEGVTEIAEEIGQVAKRLDDFIRV